MKIGDLVETLAGLSDGFQGHWPAGTRGIVRHYYNPAAISIDWLDGGPPFYVWDSVLRVIPPLEALAEQGEE